MTDGDKLARAVLLFYAPPPWTLSNREEWYALTGTNDATTRALCDLARYCLSQQKKDIGHGTDS